MNIVESIRAAGVVGAGGAGFPAHVKLNGKAEYVIANGAECEPLLRVDQLLMQREAKRVVRGVALAMEATGAARGVIATKAHYHAAVHALEQALGGRNDITLHLMDSYIPPGTKNPSSSRSQGAWFPAESCRSMWAVWSAMWQHWSTSVRLWTGRLSSARM